MKDDAWFAGYADGEGCFDLNPTKQGNRVTVRFSLGARGDDIAVLEALRDAFGGSIYEIKARATSRPARLWQVSKRSQVADLIAYFDRFPLRSKKARDYALWRRAFMISLDRGASDPEVLAMPAEMRELRAYAEPLIFLDKE